MHATPSSHLLPRVDVVYAKTVMGHHEVKHRGSGLSARQRAALIMLDGQRDASVLATVMPAGQLAPVLATLLALDLIVAVPAPGQVAVAPVLVTAPGLPESGTLAAIKAELIDAANTYLGVMGADVVARIRQAGDAAQLLRVLGHWYMAMQDSKHGKDAARSLLERTRLQLS
ncbi:MAG: hypothetical protein M3Y65_18300 [Pseudomonadota bacterium]|nr:hypothetical protein [Pseudomonadota bacterium]